MTNPTRSLHEPRLSAAQRWHAECWGAPATCEVETCGDILEDDCIERGVCDACHEEALRNA